MAAAFGPLALPSRSARPKNVFFVGRMDGNLFPINLVHENQEQFEFAPQYQVKPFCS